jgi:hypothetical protein
MYAIAQVQEPYSTVQYIVSFFFFLKKKIVITGKLIEKKNRQSALH